MENKPHKSPHLVYWKPIIVTTQTLSSSAAPQVVVTACGAPSDDSVGDMTILVFQCNEMNTKM